MKKGFTALLIISVIAALALICHWALPAPQHTSAPSETPFHTPALSYTPASSPTVKVTAPPAMPSPAPTPHITPAPAEFEINYFAIPEAIFPKLTEADKAAYKAIVGAYFNYETEAEFKASDKIQSLKFLIELCCPIIYNDVEENSIKIEGNRISWEYSDSEAEHAENIVIFENQVNEYLNYVRGVGNETARALMLYRLFGSKTYYDYSTENYLKGEAPPPEKMRDNSIDVFLSDSGICQCFARGYAFLLNQTGIEAFTACADGGIGHHEWTVVKLDGKWYYADPTWDIGGNSLSYFGIPMNRRAADGYLPENTKYFAGGDYPLTDDFSIADERFKALYTGRCGGNFYWIDIENMLVVFYRKDALGMSHISGTFDINAN